MQSNMNEPDLERLVKTALCIHFQGLARKGGSRGGSRKARPPEACRRARRRRTALQAARKRDFSAMGRCGGASATGAKKARSPEMARKAALAGVARRKERQEAEALAKGRAFAEKFKADARDKEQAFRQAWFTKT